MKTNLTGLRNAGILILLASLFFVGCNRHASNGKKVIAVIPKGVSHFFWKSVEAGALAAGRDFGVDIRWKGPAQETDYTAQINIVEDAIATRVDGIVLAPSHGDALVPAVLKANEAGIPITIFDSGISTDKYLAYVATDNRQGGVVGAERMAEKLGGKGQVAILGVKKGSVSTDQREEGFQDTIQKKFPGIKIVQFLYGDADRSKSLDRATDILTAHPDLNGIFASNESSSVGAVQAIKQKNLQGKVILVGFDSSPNLLEDVKAGAIDSLVLQDPYKMGYEGVRTIVDKMNGKQPQRMMDTGVKLLTKENMDTPEMQRLTKNP